MCVQFPRSPFCSSPFQVTSSPQTLVTDYCWIPHLPQKSDLVLVFVHKKTKTNNKQTKPSNYQPWCWAGTPLCNLLWSSLALCTLGGQDTEVNTVTVSALDHVKGALSAQHLPVLCWERPARGISETSASHLPSLSSPFTIITLFARTLLLASKASQNQFYKWIRS